ncbi:hypothetical protein AGR3A_Cc170153 [Agrobacterium tomkonis CFBP 6623]|uniref:Uncharacterized protein n=1 Tax=Agrobacterium tomkonis CFBP 6623 TaxID=1183432 RepID=A0A1S7NVP8_9HYPH|nr:hypothetical protein AGR3A_Cc170153 [Agrobacterium tomkonis CFBP 6623]
MREGQRLAIFLDLPAKDTPAKAVDAGFLAEFERYLAFAVSSGGQFVHHLDTGAVLHVAIRAGDTKAKDKLSLPWAEDIEPAATILICEVGADIIERHRA